MGRLVNTLEKTVYFTLGSKNLTNNQRDRPGEPEDPQKIRLKERLMRCATTMTRP